MTWIKPTTLPGTTIIPMDPLPGTTWIPTPPVPFPTTHPPGVSPQIGRITLSPDTDEMRAEIERLRRDIQELRSLIFIRTPMPERPERPDDV